MVIPSGCKPVKNNRFCSYAIVLVGLIEVSSYLKLDEISFAFWACNSVSAGATLMTGNVTGDQHKFLYQVQLESLHHSQWLRNWIWLKPMGGCNFGARYILSQQCRHGVRTRREKFGYI